MPAISNEIISLRITTCNAIKTLIETAKAFNEKNALKFIIEKANLSKCKTGFSENFEKAYGQYRQFKFNLKKYK